MTQTPLVSVIICFYNEERFLPEAVQSVLEQDYSNFELLLVDDGSTDGSTEQAKKLAAAYPDKVRYLEHEQHANCGLSASRNLGIREARATLVALLDADDVWLPNKLQHQLMLMEAHPEVALLLEASNYWYSWQAKEKEDVVIEIGTKEGLHPPYSLTKALYPFGPGAAPCPSGFMFRKAMIEKIGCFEAHFLERRQMYEDQAFLAKVYCQLPVWVDHSWHNYYRQREGSQVDLAHSGGHYDRVRQYFLQWVEGYWKANRLSTPETRRLLNEAWFPYRHPLQHKLRKKLQRLKNKWSTTIAAF